MRRFVFLLTVLAAAAAMAQPDSNNPTARTVIIPKASESAYWVKLEKPNQIVGHRFIYSGIVVQAVKADNPLELINPLAPPEYGSGEDNVVHDLVTKRASGLNIFSIGF